MLFLLIVIYVCFWNVYWVILYIVKWINFKIYNIFLKIGWIVEGNFYVNLLILINNLKGKFVINDFEMILKRFIVKEEWKLKNDDIVLKKEIVLVWIF